MGMSILFRNNGKYNPFREHFLELAEIFPGDEFIITTGYIQESIFYDPSNPTPNGGYIDTIAKAIENGLSNGGNVRVIAGRFWEHDSKNCNLNKQNNLYYINRSCYMCNYNHFIYYLKNQTNQNINIHNYHDSDWHAKIAVKMLNNEISGLIIGSSNLTDAAFNKPHTYPNKECDVFIWNRKVLRKSGIRCSIETMDADDILSFEGLLSTIPVQISKKGISEAIIFERVLEVLAPYR